MPEDLQDLKAVVISLGAFYNITVFGHGINTVSYLNKRKLMLVKLNSSLKRDKIMKECCKTRSLKICNIITVGTGSDLDKTLYLNDNFSPAAGSVNVVAKFKALDSVSLKPNLSFLNVQCFWCC